MGTQFFYLLRFWQVIDLGFRKKKKRRPMKVLAGRQTEQYYEQ